VDLLSLLAIADHEALFPNCQPKIKARAGRIVNIGKTTGDKESLYQGVGQGAFQGSSLGDGDVGERRSFFLFLSVRESD
jgi:hypothetical protein